ncbi:MAG: hypothetical protein LBV69_07225 [Bacteroidales bacterium]|jgi:hypothetical protein|nr:hypothetical protein [Bacteroidales bacterium]
MKNKKYLIILLILITFFNHCCSQNNQKNNIICKRIGDELSKLQLNYAYNNDTAIKYIDTALLLADTILCDCVKSLCTINTKIAFLCIKKNIQNL